MARQVPPCWFLVWLLGFECLWNIILIPTNEYILMKMNYLVGVYFSLIDDIN